jgi:hypothetical protein
LTGDANIDPKLTQRPADLIPILRPTRSATPGLERDPMLFLSNRCAVNLGKNCDSPGSKYPCELAEKYAIVSNLRTREERGQIRFKNWDYVE